MNEKEILRKHYLEQFRKYKINDTDLLFSSITENFRLFLENRPVKKVLIYQAMKSELPMEKILEKFHLDTYFPEIQGDHLVPRSVKNGMIESLDKMDLIVVPGLFVSPEGYRLGRGKGYYDRLLSSFPREQTVFAGRSWQVINEIPVDSWDKPVGFYITEQIIRQCI